MIGDIAAVLGLANQLKDTVSKNGLVDLSDLEAAQKLTGRIKSIAEQAKSGIMQYPVVFSSSMKELDLVAPVTKHLELQYALFTLITAGLNPVAMNSVGKYIETTFGAESMGEEADEDDVAFDIGEGDNDQKLASMQISQNSLTAYSFGDDDEKLSLEAQKPGNNRNGKANVKPAQPLTEAYLRDHQPTINSTTLDTKVAKNAPTVINLKMKIPGIDGPAIEMPVAVKGVPHIITPDEMRLVFEYAIQDKNLIYRIIQLTSGEIKFFRDFVLQMDRAERDSQMYKKIGRYPWYRQLIERKNIARMKKLAESAGRATTSTLPTASFVCTKEEIADAAKMRYSFLVKNPKFLKNIVDKLFLLCLAVYDQDSETIAFHFGGYDNPIIYSIRELTTGEKNIELELTKAIADLVKRVN